jgi:hypothetical protein
MTIVSGARLGSLGFGQFGSREALRVVSSIVRSGGRSG